MSNLADTPESKEPETTSEPVASSEERVSFQLLMLRSLDRIESRLDRMDQRFDRTDQRFDHIDQRIDDVRQELHSEINEVRTDLSQEISEVRTEMSSLVRWSIGVIVAVVVGAGAVVITLVSQHA